ncbi:MAG TPA: methyltransferase domain-containing protein, partial [Azospirillaceae bacterium]|nr:methyltransferase domain-containing protein [Azospirillaceae bacterium]
LMRRALRAAPGLSAAWVNLAGLEKSDENPADADAAVRLGLALAPDLAAGWFLTARLRAGAGDYDDAWTAQRRAATLEPSNPDYRRALAALEQATAKAELLTGGQAKYRFVAGTLDRVAEYYDTAITTHGPTPAGVSSTENAHEESLRRILRLLDRENGQGVRLHDVGCGYGRLFDLVKDHPALRGGSYWGCDISPAMVASARERVRDRRASFELAALPQKPGDYTIVNGVYNIKFDRPDDEWREYVQGCLLRLAATTRRGLAFSMLSCHAHRRLDGLYYPDPADFLDFTLRKISSDAALIHADDGESWVICAYAPFSSL